MYLFTLGLHNILRWVIVGLAIYTLYRGLRGWRGGVTFEEADRKAGVFFTIAMDIQLLLGLLLYFVFSPLTKMALSDFGAAMNNGELRFFAMDHVLTMVIAIVFAHIGSAAGKKDLPDQDKFRRATIFFVLALLAVLLGMPWMRPLLPF